MPKPHPKFPAPFLAPISWGVMLWFTALAADYLIHRLALIPAWQGLTGALVLPDLVATVGWGLAVWLGFAAALFLLARDDACVLLFFAAAVGSAFAVWGDWRAGAAAPILGLPRAVVLALVVLIPTAAWLYSRARHASGHLC